MKNTSKIVAALTGMLLFSNASSAVANDAGAKIEYVGFSMEGKGGASTYTLDVDPAGKTVSIDNYNFDLAKCDDGYACFGMFGRVSLAIPKDCSVVLKEWRYEDKLYRVLTVLNVDSTERDDYKYVIESRDSKEVLGVSVYSRKRGVEEFVSNDPKNSRLLREYHLVSERGVLSGMCEKGDAAN